MRILLAGLMFWAWALSAAAQPSPYEPQPEDKGLLAGCLSNGNAPEIASDRACIGVFESHCAETLGQQHYGDTYSLTTCASRERVAWDSLRDDYVTALREREDDERMAILATTLAAAEQWAHARCNYEASFTRGDMESITAASCYRTQAAEIALMLHWRLVEWSNY